MAAFNPSAAGSQTYRLFGGRTATAEYVGDCVTCGQRCWEGFGGRVALGDALAYPLGPEICQGAVLRAVAARYPLMACSPCMSVAKSCQAALRHAHDHWAAIVEREEQDHVNAA